MILFSANLGRGASTPAFRRNFDCILDAGGKRAVYALQEIDEADAPEEMAYALDRLGKTHAVVGERTTEPLFIPKHFALLDQSLSLGCRGLAKFTPNRVITEATVGIGANLEVGVLNFHLPIDRPETQARRVQMRRNVRARAKRHKHGAWAADVNTRKGWPTMVRGEVVVADAGIDKAKAWAGEGRRVVVAARQTVNLGIDGHDAHGARIRWERT